MNPILEFLHQLDFSIYHFIKQYLAPESWHAFIYFFSQEESILYAAVPAIPVILFRNWKKALCFWAVIGFTILLSDQSANIFKHKVDRWRPNQYKKPIEERKTDSFPSNHATNVSAASFVIKFFYPAVKIPTFTVLFLVCYSRIYLNKHFPFDTLAGCLLGFLCAFIILKLVWKPLKKRFPRIDLKNNPKTNVEVT